MLLSRFIKSDKISTKTNKRTNKRSQQTRSSYQSNNYLLLNYVIFNFHDVKRNLSLHEMVYINGKDKSL